MYYDLYRSFVSPALNIIVEAREIINLFICPKANVDVFSLIKLMNVKQVQK